MFNTITSEEGSSIRAVLTAQERGYGVFENVPSAERALIIVEPDEYWAFYAFRTENAVRCFTDNWQYTYGEGSNSGRGGFAGDGQAGYRRSQGLNHSINYLNMALDKMPSIEDFLKYLKRIGQNECFAAIEMTHAHQVAGMLSNVNEGWPSWCKVYDPCIVPQLDAYRDELFRNHLGIDFGDIKLIGNAEISSLVQPLGAGSPHARPRPNKYTITLAAN